MGKRYTFRCWNCLRTYTLFREITDEQTLTAACPYCNKEAVVDLTPFRRKKLSVLRGEGDQVLDEAFELPEILPTQKPE